MIPSATTHHLAIYTPGQGSEPPTFDVIKDLTTEEHVRLATAVGTVRSLSGDTPLKLLISSYRDLLTLVDSVTTASAEERFALIGRINTALVHWLLLWRLFLDQSRHRLSSSYGPESIQVAGWEQQTHQAYDGSPGYRLVEGLRNYVSHVAMPNVNFNSKSWLDAGQPRQDLRLTIDAQRLLAWKKCPRLLRQDLTLDEQPLDLVSLLADAMDAMHDLVGYVSTLDMPALVAALDLLADLHDLNPDNPPQILTMGPRPDGRPGSHMQLAMYPDLAPLIDYHRELRRDTTGSSPPDVQR